MHNRKLRFALYSQYALGVIVMFFYVLNEIFFSEFLEFLPPVLLYVSALLAFFQLRQVSINGFNFPLVFILVFFVFNVSGFFLDSLGLYDFWNNPPDSYSTEIYTGGVKAATIYLISLFLVFFAYGSLVSALFLPAVTIEDSRFVFNKILFRSVGGYLFLISIPFAAYYYFNVVTEAYLMGGYLGYLADASKAGSTNLPLIFRFSDEALVVGFWIYISTLPRKKNALLATFVYLSPYILLTVYTGSRVHASLHIFAVFIFFRIFYGIRLKLLAVGIAVFIVFLTGVSFLRSQIDYDVASMLDSMKGSEVNIFLLLLSQLGSTAHVLALTVSSIDRNMFGYSPLFFISPLFAETGYLDGKSASEYLNLADLISYYYVSSFEYGAGLGSSIVADLYAVAGVFGVIVLSACFGFLFHRIFFLLRSPVSISLIFIILPGLIYSARSHPLTFIQFSGKEVALLLLVVCGISLFKGSALFFRRH